jgi:transposase
MSGTKKSHSKRDISPTHLNAAAIDIGATMHVAAVRPDKFSEPVRSLGTFTGDLHRLADWFTKCGVRTVAMESTGVYWIPVFEILDHRGLEVIVVNARDAKHVPGRKTDHWPRIEGARLCKAVGSPAPLRPERRRPGEF